VVKNSVFDSFLGESAENRQVAQVNTYGGHPVAAAVALRNIEIMEAEKLADRAAETGKYLIDGLRTLMKHPIVGDVRGKGLLIGLDLVRDRKTKELLGRSATETIFKEALKRGLLVMGYFPRMRINPPLVITREQAAAGVEILDEVFAHVRDHLDWRNAP